MTTQVALVEDNDGDALVIEELFEDEIAPTHDPVALRRCRSVSEFLRSLEHGHPDCVLLDLGLPDAVGTIAVEAVVEHAPDLPIVVLTGSTDPELAREAIRSGAQDYLEKGPALDAEVTRRAIRYAIERAAQRRALRRSREELNDFAHRIAHDLKSPMAVIIGSAEMLEKRYDDDMARLIARSSRRLVDMVDRFLEYADTAGSDRMLSPVSFDRVVDWTIDTLGPDLDDADLDVDRPLPTVRANEVGLRHVILNLVSNALRHRDPERRPRISITCVVDDDATVVEVRDNGPGIPTELRSTVFEPGFRVDDRSSGAGLGLATVRRSMGLVGGDGGGRRRPRRTGDDDPSPVPDRRSRRCAGELTLS